MTGERLPPSRAYRFLARLSPRLRPHRRPLHAAAWLIVLGTAVGLAFPLVVRDLLDAAFVAGDQALLNRIALGLVVLFAANALIYFAQSYLMGAVSERVVAELRTDLFGHLVQQPPGYFTVRRVGELASRLNADVGILQAILRFGVPELVRQGLFLVGALVMVTITHPRLTLVTLTAIPAAALVAWLFGRRVRRLSTGIQDRLAAAMARADQVLTQIRVVQGFHQEGREAAEFRRQVDAVRDEGLRRAMARASLTGAVTFAALGAVVLVLWEGGRLVLANELTAGTLVAFLLYAVTIAGSIGSLGGFWSNLQEAAGAARRVFEILDEEPELLGPAHPVPLPSPLRGEIRFEAVRFRYAPHLPEVLRGIDAVIAPGETVCLVGSSGAGKSTLASLIPRFWDVTGGRVTVDGVDVRQVDLGALRRSIGIVPQEPMLFAGTMRENLAYGRPEATDEEIAEAARAAHADGFIRALPDGYLQRVGERGITLSAGQRQRIAIARVMLVRPPILILDEASASLDAESEALVQEALERLMEGRTTVVIAHRLSTVLRADRILVLEEGRIVDEGTHSQLLARSETYARLYRRQFEEALSQGAARE